MKAKLKDLTFGRNREQIITITTNSDFRSQFDALKEFELDVEIKRHRERRSLSANAYFHVLVNKIAECQNLGEDEVKTRLVLEYGALAKDAEDNTVGFKLPSTVDVTTLYRYAKWFDTREENGVKFDCYIVYKATHTLDSKEMARLIDGTVQTAKELGIETLPPDELARLNYE